MINLPTSPTITRSFNEFWVALRQILPLPENPIPGSDADDPAIAPLEEALQLSLCNSMQPSRVTFDKQILQRYSTIQACAGTGSQNANLLAPAAVVFPDSEQEIAQLLTWAEERELRLLPWGGGGAPYQHKQPDEKPYIAVVLHNLNRILEVDIQQRSVRVQSGITWSALEDTLASQKFTTGQHFAWSKATVGGAVATQSTSAKVLRYSDLSHNILALKALCPAGPIRLLPARPGAPDERALMLGAFGAWGIITEATLRLHPAPLERLTLIAGHASLADAVSALAQLRSAEVNFTTARITTTRELSLFHSTTTTSIRQMLRNLLGNAPAEFQMVLDFEGTREEVNTARRQTEELLSDKNIHVVKGVRESQLCLPDYAQQWTLLRELWEQRLLVHTLSAAVPWRKVAPFLRDWEEALRSILLTTGGLPGQTLTTIWAAEDHAMLRTLLLGFQPQVATASCLKQIQDIQAVALTIKQRWQVEESAAPLVNQALAKVGECLDPNGVMMR